jgi:Fe-S cluster assembly protein SufD
VPELVAAAEEVGAPALQVPGAWRILVANGVVQTAGTAPAGVIAGTVKGGVLSTRDDALTRINTALSTESLRLDLDGAVAPVIHIDRRISGGAAHCPSGAAIYVGDGGSATILETYSGSEAAHVGNHATYLALGKGATVTHVTVNLMPHVAAHFSTNEYHLGEGAALRTLVINAGAGLSRTQLFPRFEGMGASGEITGLNLVSEGQHADITMDASHAVPRTSSHPLFKAVARGHATSVVQGRLVVARDAQKTDAKLMSQGLMLTEDAQIFTKPELEIYADDVVCGHGSTCGRLDEAQLFYLMSRGVPRAEAETMLIRAFLAELIDPIESAELNEALVGVIESWLAS